MKTPWTGFLAACVCVLAACSGRTDTATTPSTEATNPGVPPTSATGLELYVTYCQGCHGTRGEGDGPVASLLKVAPADLTRLVEKYGEFPEELVASTVDGRAMVESHGSREMPVWGNVWNNPEDPLAEERLREQIGRVVEFVRSIQVTN